MKNLLLAFSFLLSFSIGLQAQSTSYEQKAKTQKTVGYVLLAGGAAMVVTSLVADLSSDSPVLLTVGAVSALASIPFFVSSSKNKKRAGGMTGLLEIQQMNAITMSPHSSNMIPALKFRISI